MALTCASMVSEVQALCGRTGDTVLICPTQVLRWFNDAQRDIAQDVRGLDALTFKNTGSLDTTAVLRYAIGDITGGDYTTQPVMDVWRVTYLDGQDSKKLTFVHTDEFDSNWPDPTHSDSVFGKPSHWTRRGSNIEIRPVCSSGYYDKDLRFDGQFYPREFTDADVTVYADISNADDLLKLYALSKAWHAIGKIDKGVDYSIQYDAAKSHYQDYAERLDAWTGGMYDDDIE
jgi:hypothetical protein